MTSCITAKGLTKSVADSSVSKQKDPSRVVSQSAYLLFYRRRSDVPLGGPRFQQILQDFDNPPDTPADDISESGEDQGLVANSSLRGSSSALTGVGAAHHPPNGLDGAATMTVNPSVLDLPPYEAHDSNDDGVPLLDKDGDMPWEGSVQRSIEPADEGIEMEDNHYNPLNQMWNFANLGTNSRGDQMISGTGSDAEDAASDVVQNNSSADASDVAERMQDFADADPVDEDGNFINQSPVPDLDEEGQAANIALQADLMENMHRAGNLPIFQATQFEVDERLDVEEPATEIHLDNDSEDLKMD